MSEVGPRFQAPAEGGDFSLAARDTSARGGMRRKEAERTLQRRSEALAQLQERLFAEGRRSLLIVLQGMDASGKDGTVSHVMAQVNPQGVDVTSFKAPSAAEKRHPFLWRIRRRLPANGRIGIFNRSHYEDVLVPLVHGTVAAAAIERRYGTINRFETQLTASGTTVLKFMLHISFEEQRARLLDRLRDPDKRWKFSPNDLKERADWDAYMAAFDRMITHTSTAAAPWYVIPSDRKWFRNWAIAEIVVERLRALNPTYPQPDLDLPTLEARLTRT